MEELLTSHPALAICKQRILEAFSIMKESFRSGGKLLVCGNGGSAADSEHIVGELMKGFMHKRRIPDSVCKKILEVSPRNGAFICDSLQGALPAISLTSHTSLISAYSNDVEPSLVFAQQVYGYGKEGDVFLGISTSGESKNIVHAAEVAKAMGLRTIALTGESGGLLGNICDCVIRAPSKTTPEIQEMHLPIYHSLCQMLEAEFFGDGE